MPEPEPSTAAVWEDFIDIFYAPSSVFERRRGWSAWPVLLVLTLLLTALVVTWQRAMGPLLDAEMQRAMAEAMAQNPEMEADQLGQMGSMGRAFGAIGFAVGFPIATLVVALVTWGLTRLFGATAEFAGVFGVVVYSRIVRLLEYALGLLQGSVLDVGRYDSIHDVSFSLARFLDQSEASSLAVQLAARVDVFTLWTAALIAIGLHTVTALTRERSWAVALLVWLLGAVPVLAGALVGSMMGG